MAGQAISSARSLLNDIEGYSYSPEEKILVINFKTDLISLRSMLHFCFRVECMVDGEIKNDPEIRDIRDYYIRNGSCSRIKIAMPSNIFNEQEKIVRIKLFDLIDLENDERGKIFHESIAIDLAKN